MKSSLTINSKTSRYLPEKSRVLLCYTLRMARKINIPEIVGWYGTTAIVGAYALVSFQVIAADGSLYQLLNLTGAIGIIIISLIKKVRQTVLLNLFWAVIAIASLARIALT